MVKRDRDEETGKTIDLSPLSREELVAQSTDEKGRFLPGNKLGGRPKGARSKIEERFLNDLLDNWRRRGKDAIDRACDQDPMGYVRVVASLLPRVKPDTGEDHGDVNVNVTIQVQDFMGKLRQIIDRQAEMKMIESAAAEPEDGGTA